MVADTTRPPIHLINQSCRKNFHTRIYTLNFSYHQDRKNALIQQRYGARALVVQQNKKSGDVEII